MKKKNNLIYFLIGLVVLIIIWRVGLFKDLIPGMVYEGSITKPVGLNCVLVNESSVVNEFSCDVDKCVVNVFYSNNDFTLSTITVNDTNITKYSITKFVTVHDKNTTRVVNLSGETISSEQLSDLSSLTNIVISSGGYVSALGASISYKKYHPCVDCPLGTGICVVGAVECGVNNTYKPCIDVGGGCGIWYNGVKVVPEHHVCVNNKIICNNECPEEGKYIVSNNMTAYQQCLRDSSNCLYLGSLKYCPAGLVFNGSSCVGNQSVTQPTSSSTSSSQSYVVWVLSNGTCSQLQSSSPANGVSSFNSLQECNSKIMKKNYIVYYVFGVVLLIIFSIMLFFRKKK